MKSLAIGLMFTAGVLMTPASFVTVDVTNEFGYTGEDSASNRVESISEVPMSTEADEIFEKYVSEDGTIDYSKQTHEGTQNLVEEEREQTTEEVKEMNKEDSKKSHLVVIMLGVLGIAAAFVCLSKKIKK